MTNTHETKDGWFDTPPPHITRNVTMDDAALPPLWRLAVLVIGGIMVVFTGWAAFTRVDEVAGGTGQVIPAGYVQTIQHLEGGIIRDILVTEGQLVEKGQMLLRFDGTAATADLDQMRAREKALGQEAQRLKIFVSDGVITDMSSMSSDQRDILSAMQESRAGQQNILLDQIAQKEKELKAAQSSLVALNQNVTLMEREAAVHVRMARDGIGSQLGAMTAQRELNQLRGQRDEAASQVKRASDALREAQNRLHALEADLRQEALKTLDDIEAERAELRASLAKYTDTASRTVIAAPMRGVVKGLSVHTVGAVVESGRVLMEIVPVDDVLIVEAMVPPALVGNLQPDQNARVKVTAFDFARHGVVTGRVDTVSATSFVAEDGQSFYKVRIKLDQPFVGGDPNRNRIIPGMTVDAGIITGRKTVLQYLLKPIHTAVENAFTEI